jgi:hypothetical protein
MTSFGWGQRQCLGQTLTQDELIVACGALAWAFNLRRKTDPNTGVEVPVPLDKSNSLLIIRPDPFSMAFEPRSEKRKEEALRIWSQAQRDDIAARMAFLEGLGNERGEKVEAEPLPINGNGVRKDWLCDKVRDAEKERTSVNLDRLEQLKRDILIHIKSVPEIHIDPTPTAPMINRSHS